MFTSLRLSKMHSVLSKLKDDGFAVFEGSLFGEDALSIANNLGTIAPVPGAEIVQSLVPSDSVGKEASSYSGNYGMGEFPFHSDMAHWYKPPRFLLLRCIIPSPVVVTRILKAAPLFDGENKNDLRRALFKPRRRLNGRLSPLRLFEGNFYRWDTLFIEPHSNLAKLLQIRISNRISTSISIDIALENAGHSILIDNWQTFHARSAVPPEASNRKLERVYISTLKGW